MLSAFDLFLDGKLDRDWSGELRAFFDEQRAKADAELAALESKRVSDAPPSLPLARYVGRYEDPLAGTVECSLDGDGLRLRWGRLVVGRATPWNYDTFRVD